MSICPDCSNYPKAFQDKKVGNHSHFKGSCDFKGNLLGVHFTSG